MRLQTKETEALFGRMYKSFPAVRKYIKENGGKTEDAKDVFQEGLIVLYHKLQQPDLVLTAKEETLLFSICRFKWMEELRRREKMNQSNIDHEQFSLTEEESEKERMIGIVEKALSSLGERCKKLLEAFYFEGKAIPQIASAFGFKSDNSAKTQKHKCLESARKLATIALAENAES